MSEVQKAAAYQHGKVCFQSGSACTMHACFCNEELGAEFDRGHRDAYLASIQVNTMPMPEHLKVVLDTIPQQSQRQDSTNAQLQDLRAFAIRLGLYDADNVLRIMLEQKD